MIEYLPALEPDRYRVRRLELDTGRMTGVFTVDGQLQGAMKGSARTQALAPDGTRLYTLYWLADETQNEGHAFVHVLSLDGQWAHCVDLPPSVGSGSERADALALSSDGRRLYVVDVEQDRLAEIDTERLRVVRTTAAPLTFAGPVRAAVGPDDTVYASSGRTILAIDASRHGSPTSWTFGSNVTGLQPAADGRRIYVALTNRIDIFDRVVGRATRSLRVPGMTAIDQLGAVSAGLDSARTQILCAC